MPRMFTGLAKVCFEVSWHLQHGLPDLRGSTIGRLDDVEDSKLVSAPNPELDPVFERW
jgi:hypothetical protein